MVQLLLLPQDAFKPSFDSTLSILFKGDVLIGPGADDDDGPEIAGGECAD